MCRSPSVSSKSRGCRSCSVVSWCNLAQISVDRCIRWGPLVNHFGSGGVSHTLQNLGTWLSARGTRFCNGAIKASPDDRVRATRLSFLTCRACLKHIRCSERLTRVSRGRDRGTLYIVRTQARSEVQKLGVLTLVREVGASAYQPKPMTGTKPGVRLSLGIQSLLPGGEWTGTQGCRVWGKNYPLWEHH